MVREHLGVETPYAANSVVGVDSHCHGWGLLTAAGLTENRFCPTSATRHRGGAGSRQQPVRGRASSWSRSGRGKAEESSSGWVGAVGDAGLEEPALPIAEGIGVTVLGPVGITTGLDAGAADWVGVGLGCPETRMRCVAVRPLTVRVRVTSPVRRIVTFPVAGSTAARADLGAFNGSPTNTPSPNHFVDMGQRIGTSTPY